MESIAFARELPIGLGTASGFDTRRWHDSSRLERPQEVDDVLLLLSVQLIEAFDNLIRLALAAPVSFDCLQKIACPPIMKEENPLPDTPERGRSELIRTRGTLRDTVREVSTHVMEEKVGPEIYRLVG